MGGNITLTAAVRQNLLTLRSTDSLMSGVQNRLATGLRVNSALDNPNSFFTASGLNARASDLGNLLDDMGQSLQTIKAADEGIQSITKLVESAKAKANQALQTQSQYERAQFAEQYNGLLAQIEAVAGDSSYKGKNLLAGAGNDLTAIFNEDSTSRMKIAAVDYTDTALSDGLNLSLLDEAEGGAAAFQLTGGGATFSLTGGAGDAIGAGALLSESTLFSVGNVIDYENLSHAVLGSLTVTGTTTVQDLIDGINAFPGVSAELNEADGTMSISAIDGFQLYNNGTGSHHGTASVTNFSSLSESLTKSGGFKAGDVLTLSDGNNYDLGSLEITDNTTVADLEDFLNDYDGISASFNTATGRMTIISETDLSLTSTNVNFNAEGGVTDPDGVVISAQQDSSFATDSKISRVLTKVNSALGMLRSQASDFGTKLSTVQIRQDYTTSLINTLQEGAGKLTLADSNEEGASLLALQTRQQLASTSLSFASQADQTVLSLF